ncbi:MAG: transglutaminase-like domain-containing protein [Alphaproteobacteria bacterium]
MERKQAERILREVGASDGAAVDIAGAALALASFDRPRVGLDRYHQHLAALASDVGRAAGGADSLSERLDAMNTTLVSQYGYSGDALNYDDMQNANLMRVIDRRKGLPVALGILYIHVARAQAWPITGLAFPGHFLLRLDGGNARLVIDPFHGGTPLEPHNLRDMLKSMTGSDAELLPEHYAPVSDRDVLIRLQNNIKLRKIQNNDAEGACAIVDSMLLLAPGEPALWRESGLLNAKASRFQAAMNALETFLTFDVGQAARIEAASLLQQIRERLN